MKSAFPALPLVILLFFPIQLLFAQKSNPNPGQNQAKITQEFIESQMNEAKKGIGSNREIEGSPYYREDWNPGYFIKTNDKATSSYPMRFNINKNQLEFKFDENTLYIASPKPIKGFVLTPKNGPIITFKQGYDIPNSNISQNTFVQVLHDGKTKLLLHHRNRLLKGHSKDMFTGKITDRYISESNYYLIDENGQAEQVKLREKDLLKKLAKSLKTQLKTFIDKNKLNLKSEEDVITLLAEYDRFLSESLN